MGQKPPWEISAAVEGDVDDAVLRRLVQTVGGGLHRVYGKEGKAGLIKRLQSYNSAARYAPWVVLVDLDCDFDCAPPFCKEHLPHPARWMCFRVAVREVEAWFMADRERLARFLGIPLERVPLNPESEMDPKRMLVDMARDSRRRAVRLDMVPRPGSGRSVGPAYTSCLIEFARTVWRPEEAARRSDSLRRCLRSLRGLRSHYHG